MLLLFNDTVAEHPGNDAIRAFSEVVERYSADDRVRMERKSPHWQNHETVLRTSPFSDVERRVALHRGATTVDLLVHRALSMSATSESRLGPRAEAMVAELRSTLAPFAARGPLVEWLDWTVLIARRPRPTSG
jgi:hypothetical protein